jgi:hypothetical protein
MYIRVTTRTTGLLFFGYLQTRTQTRRELAQRHDVAGRLLGGDERSVKRRSQRLVRRWEQVAVGSAASVVVTNTVYMAQVSCVVVVTGTGGTLELRFRPEVTTFGTRLPRWRLPPARIPRNRRVRHHEGRGVGAFCGGDERARRTPSRAPARRPRAIRRHPTSIPVRQRSRHSSRLRPETPASWPNH